MGVGAGTRVGVAAGIGVGVGTGVGVVVDDGVCVGGGARVGVGLAVATSAGVGARGSDGSGVLAGRVVASKVEVGTGVPVGVAVGAIVNGPVDGGGGLVVDSAWQATNTSALMATARAQYHLVTIQIFSMKQQVKTRPHAPQRETSGRQRSIWTTPWPSAPHRQCSEWSQCQAIGPCHLAAGTAMI